MINQPTTYLQKYKLKVKQPIIIGRDFLKSFIESCKEMRKRQEEQTGIIQRPSLTNTLQLKIVKFWNKLDGIRMCMYGLTKSDMQNAKGLQWVIINKYLHEIPTYPFEKIKNIFVERKAVELYLEPATLLNVFLKGPSVDHYIITCLYNLYYTTLLRVMAENPQFETVHNYVINRLKIKLSAIPEGITLPSIDYNKLISVLCGDQYWLIKTQSRQALTDLMLLLYIISSLLLKDYPISSGFHFSFVSLEIKVDSDWKPLILSYPTITVDHWSFFGPTMPAAFIPVFNAHLLHFDRFIAPQLMNVTSVRFQTPRIGGHLINYSFLTTWCDLYLKSIPVGYYSIELPFGELFLMSASAHLYLAVAMRAVFTELKRLQKKI